MVPNESILGVANKDGDQSFPVSQQTYTWSASFEFMQCIGVDLFFSCICLPVLFQSWSNYLSGV